ncbi:uncharacterized protein ACA1_330110 [Acanthamoeba castellanii str. Neff]|uniref:Hyaluronan-mediated motility receptor C-terminal domain-containing protein n=1 Tax=Acanthamoeba castellanii (strain ATCC 30010 / Neff) TaxID=1257118 RepID=L8GHK3_ACACF|nr:uncharacterized protein ACA1_330110 [Acanthamoeba castellanii str. Neff]ELR12467.1 hypothetical protein ACA1_330110 [Acanthamoeba castellanii str. Neff]
MKDAKAGERVVAARDEEIEHLTRELEAAEAKSQEVSRRLAQLADEQAADYERRIDSLNREVEAMQRLSDGELAKLQLELDRRALEFETEKERRDHRERELDEAKAEALDQQRRYYEKEMTRIKEEMARQWAEWENRGREDERETKGMILRLNEEKEELIARARKDRDDAQLEHQRTAALLEDRLRQTADAAQATEARLRGELSRIEEELAAVAEAKAALELRTDEQRRAFEQQIAGLESSIAATSHELTAELGVLRDELDAAQRANRDLQSTHDAEREQLARDSESAIATLRAAHDAELAQQAAGRESEAETLRVAHDAALEQLTTLLSAKASEVEALERLVREKESEIESAKDDARRERDELATLHLGQRAELAAALEAKEREMAELREVEARARREVEERAAAEVTRLEQAKKAELTELEEKHGREIEELTAQEKRMMHDFAVMKEEIEKSINERIDYIKQIETRRQAERQAQDEIARLNDTITRMQKDFKSLMQEKHQLEARVEELVLINGKLTGHQNLNQKIQHHVKVKQENNSLKIQLQKLKKELDRTKSELAKFRPEGSVDLAADEDEEEKLKKQLVQQEEVIGALDAQLKALRGQLSSLYNAHIGSTTATTLTGGDAVSSDETTEAEDASFSWA